MRPAPTGGRPPAPTFYWQLQGKVRTTVPAAVYDVDGFETGAEEVAALHAHGKHVVCYIDVGTAENFRPDYHEFPNSVLGRSNGWPGERWLDIRQLSVLEPIMAARLRMCEEKGFDALEPDNIEAFSNKSGFPITAAEQLTYNEWVAEEAHSLGLAVLQKNDGEQAAELEPYFDGVAHRAVQPVPGMLGLRALSRRRQAGDQRGVQAEDGEVLRCGRSRRHRRRPLQPGAQRQALRTLLVSRG